MGYNSAIKRNELIIHITNWMNLQGLEKANPKRSHTV